jgi:glutathione S-transferase
LKLYNLDHSPYATRVRMQIRKKNLDVELAPSPVPLRTDEFNERFPLGKLPVLELDDGEHIAESWTIMEYLEDVFPEPTLRPRDALAKAQMSMLARCADNHLGPGGLFPMFGMLVGGAGITNSEAMVAGLDNELARLQRLLAALPDFRWRSLHLGDIAMVPHLAYALLIAPAFGCSDTLSKFPGVAGWWEWVQSDAAVAETTAEMQAAFQAFAAAKK